MRVYPTVKLTHLENGMWNQKKIFHLINAKIILKPLTANLFNI